MRKLTAPGHAGLGALGALILGSTFAFVACAPAPMDAQTNTTRASGGSTGSSSGGSSGSSNGGSSGSSTGGSSGSSTGGSSGGSSSGGSSGGSSTGGSSGGSSSGGSSGSSSGGSSGSSSGGSSGSGSGGGGGMRMDAAAPADMGGGSPAAGATFSDVYSMVIMPKCLPCHNAAKGALLGPLNNKMAAYTALSGKVMAGNPASSKLVMLITPAGGKAAMPKNMPPLTDDLIEKVKSWIMAGAKND